MSVLIYSSITTVIIFPVFDYVFYLMSSDTYGLLKYVQNFAGILDWYTFEVLQDIDTPIAGIACLLYMRVGSICQLEKT